MIDPALLGLPPEDPYVTAIRLGIPFDPSDMSGSGLTPVIADWFERFEASDRSKALMRVARRAGIPFSVVAEQWSREDLAAEIAWDIWLAQEEAQRCSDCGVHPEEMEADGRRIAHPKWFVDEWVCPGCKALESQRHHNRVAQKDSETPPFGLKTGLKPRPHDGPETD